MLKGLKKKYKFADLPSVSNDLGCHLKLVFDEMPGESD